MVSSESIGGQNCRCSSFSSTTASFQFQMLPWIKATVALELFHANIAISHGDVGAVYVKVPFASLFILN